MPTVNVYSYLIIAAFNPHTPHTHPQRDRPHTHTHHTQPCLRLERIRKPKLRMMSEESNFQKRRKRRTEAKTQ